jgi:hypothetical protein
MKTHLFTLKAAGALLAAGAVLTGCGAPSAGGVPPARFGQDAAGLPAFEVKKAATQSSGDETPAKKPKPFFKQQQLLAIMQETAATADVLDGVTQTEAAAAEVSFDVRGVEKVESDTVIEVSGKLTFRDTTRKLRFQGDVTGRNVYISDQILWSNLTGVLDDGSPFSLAMGEISIYKVNFTFQVHGPDGAVRYQYTGEGEKGKLKTMRN